MALRLGGRGFFCIVWAGQRGIPTQVKRAIPSPALLPAAAGSHPSGHLLWEHPAARLGVSSWGL